MEQITRPRGDTNEITTHDEPVIYDYDASTATPPPPVTFAEAERHNPYALLTELHDHGMNWPLRHEHPPNPAHHLAELALSAAVVSWWSRWQPVAMHRALAAGASLAEVAAAAGISKAEVRKQWLAWVEDQERLFLDCGLGVDPLEANAIRQRLARRRPG